MMELGGGIHGVPNISWLCILSNCCFSESSHNDHVLNRLSFFRVKDPFKASSSDDIGIGLMDESKIDRI